MENPSPTQMLEPSAPMEETPAKGQARTGSTSDHAPGPTAQKVISALFLVLIAYSAVRSTYRAASKPFWSDEVCTVIVARQPSFSMMWKALREGIDGQPPAFYVVERFFDRWIPKEEIAFRVPAIAGFCITLWCLFLWIKRRYGALVAATAGIIPLLTALYDPYAVEARPYTWIVACLAMALLCYQRAPKTIWMVGMGVSLALAESFHHYAVLAMVPIVAAEAVFLLKTKWLRRGVWVALFCGALPVLVSLPLLFGLKKYYSGPHYWSQPTIKTALGLYNWIFHLAPVFDRNYPTTAEAILLAVLFNVGAGCAIGFLAYRSLSAKPESEPLFHEPMLFAVYLGLPFVIYGATKLTNGGETERYMLATLIGISLGTAYAMRRAKWKFVTVLCALVLLCVSSQDASFWITRYELSQLAPGGKTYEGLIESAGHEDLPVVVSEGLAYLPMVHYALPAQKHRLVSLVDLPNALKYTGNDSIDKQLLIARNFAPMQVYEFDAFRKVHPMFLLYSRTSGEYYQDWWPRCLASEGYSLKTVAKHGIESVYLVEERPGIR